MVTLIAKQTLVLALLIVPAFAANEGNYNYLALGDSVAFGYDPTVTAPAPDKYTGYPEVVASVEHLLKPKKEVNSACPGETSASFLFGPPDNGCQAFKTAFGVHTSYPGTQASFALSQLQNNKHIDLVTLSIGGNNLLLLEALCSDPSVPSFTACVQAHVPGVLQSYGQDLTQILAAIRANYGGTLILLKYYPTNADPLFIQVIAALNQVMVQVGTPFGARFADGFTAFEVASALFNGDPCAAGLLVRLSATSCDVHPSPRGRDILAATVVLQIARND